MRQHTPDSEISPLTMPLPLHWLLRRVAPALTPLWRHSLVFITQSCVFPVHPAARPEPVSGSSAIRTADAVSDHAAGAAHDDLCSPGAVGSASAKPSAPPSPGPARTVDSVDVPSRRPLFTESHDIADYADVCSDDASMYIVKTKWDFLWAGSHCFPYTPKREKRGKGTRLQNTSLNSCG